MNVNQKSNALPLMAAGLGSIALLLRLGLYRFGTDEKGLLEDGHILNLLVWAVCAFALAYLCLRIRTLDGSPKYAHNFSPSAPAAAGAFALAGGIAVSLILTPGSSLRLDLLRTVSGLLSIPSLVWVGLCRRKGKRPFFLGHAALCLHLTLYTICHYQIWSSRPQLQDYFFAMAGAIGLTLFSYYQTEFDVGLGKRRMQLGTGLLAAFFCIAALAGGEDLLLYGSGALWALTNLCSLTPVKRRRPNPITESGKDEPHASA